MSIKSEQIEKKIRERCLSILKKYDDTHFPINNNMKNLLTGEARAFGSDIKMSAVRYPYQKHRG